MGALGSQLDCRSRPGVGHFAGSRTRRRPFGGPLTRAESITPSGSGSGSPASGPISPSSTIRSAPAKMPTPIGCAKRVWDWYKSDLSPRMKPGGRQILIQTRWHEDDLAGRLIEEMNRGGDHWDILSLAAEAEYDDPLGRQPGEWLWDDGLRLWQVSPSRKKRRNSHAIGRRSISRSRRPIRAIISRRNGSSPTMTHRRTRHDDDLRGVRLCGDR